MNLQSLFREIRSREDSFISGDRAIASGEIQAFEQSHDLQLPKSYRLFLMEFGLGGEYIFARMRPQLEDDEEVEGFWEYWQTALGENCKSRFFPIGDDYAGNYYCFELDKIAGDDCPLVLIDDALLDNPDELIRFDSFTKLIEAALRGEGIFA